MRNGSFNGSWESSQHLRPARLEADISWLIGMMSPPKGQVPLPNSDLLKLKTGDDDVLGGPKSPLAE